MPHCQRNTAAVVAVAIFLLLWSTCTTAETISTALATHVVNITLNGATTGWPTTQTALSGLDSTVTSTICAELSISSGSCSAFLMLISTGILGLQVQVESVDTNTSSVAYRTLYGWSENSVSPPLSALQTACATVLGTSLSALTYSSGVYTMPCRGTKVYSFLPACATGEIPFTVFYVNNSVGDVSSYLSTYLCASMSSCTDLSITVQAPTSSQPFSVVNITGASMALEAVLSYVADVRAAYQVTQSITPSVGNSNAGVSASGVYMRSGILQAVLFSTNESTQSVSGDFQVTFSCEASTNYWVFSLIAVLPLGVILFRYIWHRGRHRAKKQERKRVVEDEMRIMQGYASSNNQVETANNPPPGVDASGSTAAAAANATPQWVLGSDGYYYDVSGSPDYQGNGDGGAVPVNAVAGEDADAQDGSNVSPVYRTYTDPNTGETYQYLDPGADDGGGAAGDNTYGQAANEYDPNNAAYSSGISEVYQSGTANGADGGGTGNEGADGSIQQNATYVDPNTGETYHYVESGADGADGLQQQGYEEGQMDENGYVTYVDPNTGETYQYLDPQSAAAQQGTAPNTVEGGTADAGTYIDPNTDEAYQ